MGYLSSEEVFENYRTGYFHIITSLDATFELFFYIENRRVDSMKELKIASSFWSIIRFTLLKSIIIDLTKLFENRGNGKHLSKFLNFVESNQTLFQHEESVLNNWGVEERISLALIESQRTAIQSNQKIIDKIIKWRDKTIAHLDNKYLSSPDQLSIDFPIFYTDIQSLISLASNIFRVYSLLFDGQYQEYHAKNIEEIANLFKILKIVTHNPEDIAPLWRKSLKKDWLKCVDFIRSDNRDFSI